MTPPQSTRRLLTWINHLPDRRWFWVPVFGLALAAVVMPMIVVTATTLNLPMSEWASWGGSEWVVWAVILACMAGVWRISHWLVPAGPQRRPHP